MTRPNTVNLENWVDPQPIADAAAALRSDAAAYEKLANEVEPVWNDLRYHFRLWGQEDNLIQAQGTRISGYAETVGRGAANMAKILEDCASSIRGLEPARQHALNTALAARQGLINNPFPTAEDPEPELYLNRLSLHNEALRAVTEAENEIVQVVGKYQGALQDAADQIGALKDDGDTPGNIPWGLILDGGLIVVGMYIPPLAIAGAGAKTAYTSYQARIRQLKEDNPGLSDTQRRNNAAGYATVMTGVAVTTGYGAGSVAGSAAGNAAGNWAGREAGEKAVDGVTSWWVGNVESNVGSEVGMPEGGRGPVPHAPWFDPPGTADPPPSVKPPLAVPPDINDPDRVQETKDYDRDGYTDPPFRPGASPRMIEPDGHDLEDYDEPVQASTVVRPPLFERPNPE